MSVGSTGGVLGSAAGAPLSQAKSDSERSAVDGAGRDRQADDGKRAEKSSGVGQTEEDQGASDRDADGRKHWDPPAEPNTAGEEAGDASGNGGGPVHQPVSKDPNGVAGNRLDLLG